jgi:serine/threonine-protein kinase
VLEGKYHASFGSEADTRKAIERFSLATRLDPRYALAWSRLSRSWTYLAARYLDVEPAKQAYANARAAADTALTLAPDLASAHLARGRLLQLADFDWHGAEVEFRRGLEPVPRDVDASFISAPARDTGRWIRHRVV